MTGMTTTKRYDDLGQVISGKKYWPDTSEVAGQQLATALTTLATG